MTPREKIIKARTALILDKPFFGSLALRTEFMLDPTCDTAWTNGKMCGLNPKWVDSLNVDSVKFVIAHEIMHIAMLHPLRMKGRRGELWNVACDYAINGILKDDKFAVLSWALLNDEFKDMSAEQIYKILLTREIETEEQLKINNIQCQGQGQGQGQEDQCQGQGESQDQEQKQDDQDQEDQKQGQGSGQDQDQEQEGQGSGQDQDQEQEVQKQGQGSGQDQDQSQDKNRKQERNNNEPHNEDPGKCGSVRPYPSQSPTMDAQAENDMRVSVMQAITLAKSAGSLPGSLQRFIDDILASKVNWREVLRRFVDQSANNDYTWTRPNKRYLYSGFYLPSLHADGLGEIVVAIDTSGSIDREMLNSFASELSQIISEYQVDCHVVYADSNVRGVEHFTSKDIPLKLNPVGGGGTNFVPTFKWVEEQQINPRCLIYLTDLECWSFPDLQPDYPVLWARTGGYENKYLSWGEIVDIDD